MIRKIGIHLFALSAMLTLFAAIARPQGLGGGLIGKKSETMLKRKLAPYVVIKNKRIKIIAESQGNVPKEIAEILKTKFRVDVQKDLGYIVDDENPETILVFTATAFDVEFRQGTRQSGNSVVNYTLVNGNVEVSYQALEAKTNAPLDSENLVDRFNQDFPPSGYSDSGWIKVNPIDKVNPWKDRNMSVPPSQSEVRSLLIQNIVKLMAQRAAPVEERFTVPLPKGKFDQLSRVALTQSWTKVLEGAETMAPLEKEKDDSYRHYLIGLANEALAYEQKTDDLTREFLFKARKAYDDARMKNPGEKEYIAPWTRVDKAVAQYDKIKRQAEEYRQYLASKKGIRTPPKPDAPPAETKPTAPPKEKANQSAPAAEENPASAAWTNQTVIRLWKKNKSEKILLQAVKNVPQFNFDTTSEKGLEELMAAEVPEAIITVMMEKMASGKSQSAPGKKKPRGSGRKSKP